MPRPGLFLARGLPTALALWWLLTQASRPEAAIPTETWLLVIASALANVIVLTYHYTIPAHPKFIVRPWRRTVLRIHIISGSIELVAGLMACFQGSPKAAIVMAVAALGLHVPSALLQLPIVFGSRAIMEPAYLLCIITHAVCATMLLINPHSHLWAVNTFLVFNIYVWCRLYFYVFDLLALFRPMKYSAAILAAGFTVLPAVFGPTGILACIGFIGLYIGAHRVFAYRHLQEYEDFTRERARDTNLPVAMLERLDAALPTETAETECAIWFQHLNRSDQGTLARDALLRALHPWGLPASSATAFAERLYAEGPVTLERFRETIWSVGAIRLHARRTLALERASTDRERATLVFTILDLDRDGFLGREEMDWLLGEWGLPPSETAYYLAQAGDAEGRISLAAFIAQLEPVWRYVFDEILRAGFSTSRNEMIQRGASTAIGALRSSGLRQLIRRELLQTVPFLAEADDELIGNLAASLTVESFPAGSVVLREGQPGDTFYLIANGAVQIERHGKVLAHLGAGGSIGEGSLLTRMPRSATVTTIEETTFFVLSRPAFAHLTVSYPQVSNHLKELHQARQNANLASTTEERAETHPPSIQLPRP